MTKSVLTLLIFLSLVLNISAQDLKRWKFEAESNFYFTDPFIIIPIIKADKDNLHLESRYNYEDLKTISFWGGYNIGGGKKFTYSFTPMAGAIAGRTNGAAAGLEMNLGFAGLNLYAESEYVFNFESKEDNFFYNWLDFTYAPIDFIWFGVSGQRTKALNQDPDIQHGFLVGGNLMNVEVNGYLYNPGKDDPTYILSVSLSFE